MTEKKNDYLKITQPYWEIIALKKNWCVVFNWFLPYMKNTMKIIRES